jgi:hypothetical protein
MRSLARFGMRIDGKRGKERGRKGKEEDRASLYPLNVVFVVEVVGVMAGTCW